MYHMLLKDHLRITNYDIHEFSTYTVTLYQLITGPAGETYHDRASLGNHNNSQAQIVPAQPV